MKAIDYVLAFFLMVALTVWVMTEVKADHDAFPPQVVEWAQKNVYIVHVSNGVGSGFWVSNTTFISACHVVEGFKEAWLTNEETTRLFIVDVKSCNTTTDIAVLKRRGTEGEKSFSAEKTEIRDKPPKQGAVVYGVGHPLGMRLVITQGHYQHEVEHPERMGMQLITTPTISGDSGSPIIGLDHGKVVIYGVRSSIRTVPTGPNTMSIVTHLTLMSSGHNVLEELYR